MSRYLQLTAGTGMAVVSYDVFFVNEESARQCALKYGAEVQKEDDGWLVKKTRVLPSDDDPIVRVIEGALADARQRGDLPT
jgi:hypothetical protein